MEPIEAHGVLIGRDVCQTFPEGMLSMNRTWVAATVVMAMWAATAGAGDSLADWELEFGGEVLRAAIGEKCSYYVLNVPNSSRNAPGLKAER